MAKGRSATIPPGNRLLDALPPADQAGLAPYLEKVDLEMKELLFEQGKRFDRVYFPLTAVVSLLSVMEDTSGVEIATVGNEGLVGVPVSWGVTMLNPRELIQAQVPGEALVMDVDIFTSRMSQPGELTELVHLYTQALFSQIAQQVACNSLHSVEERCARWLLLTHDRVGVDEFPLTQEFLSQMLGVRRASVTVVSGAFQQAGFIRFRRGWVTITDRQGLESTSCECYHVVREVFDRLLG
ncbi:MAG TPA: Crp/Fnr family transcriptional regulator [Acidimicrobiales bacterium]|jgi:CRP-like cAMP-binding protein|nr:Crp/Fnr family transcriptional regulator [Acidimicrobiales bacterium]